MTPRTTIQALAAMNDEGLFEQVATAVLREENQWYRALSHPGINTDGKTKKSPVDGICFVPGANPPHCIVAHHTTTQLAKLKEKWLHDPTTTKPRKRSRRSRRISSGTAEGDLIKTAREIAEERRRTPNLRATLILTTNRDPGAQLMLEVRAAAAAQNIDVDIWPASQIAHILDNHPTGQWIRRKLLGIEQERLSKELLAELSQRSLELIQVYDNPHARVPRAIDHDIATSRRAAIFLVADSGQGKSVICYRALQAHLQANGYGLVLPYQVVEQAITMEQALSETVKQLHPALGVGQSPLEFCSKERPLLVIIEDLNKSGQAQRLIERLVSWVRRANNETATPTGAWRLVCPIWHQTLGAIDEQLRRVLAPMIVPLDPFTDTEARSAILLRANLANHIVSEVTADGISEALGRDPLLIALYEFGTPLDPGNILADFVEGSLQKAASTNGCAAAELQGSLMSLAAQMLRHRRLDLSWRELASWGLPQRVVDDIRTIGSSGRLFRLTGTSKDLRLSFRHDRVREWILIEAATEMDVADLLPDDVIAEPFFAEVLGGVVIRRGANLSLLHRMQRLNALALFHALRRAPPERTTERAQIVKAIVAWLTDPTNRRFAQASLRWDALVALEGTDGEEVHDILDLFPEDTVHSDLARLRNGHIEGGIGTCIAYSLGDRAPIRDCYIAHARLYFGDQLREKIDMSLRQPNLSDRNRGALLRFAGYFSDPRLGSAVRHSWQADHARIQRLQEYLWAFAKCCDQDSVHEYLDPVCAEWAALPDTKDPARISPRYSIAAYGVKWAFEQSPPVSALAYFVARAKHNDLASPLTELLAGVDHPIAIRFIVDAVADRIRRYGHAETLGSTVIDHWSRVQEEGMPMSPASREMLLRLWGDRANDPSLRIAAFAVWSATRQHDDIELLRDAGGDTDLRDSILVQRLIRSDAMTVPDLLKKLHERESGWRWWCYAQHVWCPELTIALDDALAWRGQHILREWNSEFKGDSYTSDMIIRLPEREAERLLQKHWDHLSYSAPFLQAALYVATPELLAKAESAISAAPDAAYLLKGLSTRYGINQYGHPGVTREIQVTALRPFLHLLDETTLFYLALACNQQGWFEIRRQLLDDRVFGTERKKRFVSWDLENSAAIFNELMSKDDGLWINNDIDEALRTGITWSVYLRALENWLKAHPSIEALRVVARALIYKGSRTDLRVLDEYNDMDSEAKALIASTVFAVRRRVFE